MPLVEWVLYVPSLLIILLAVVVSIRWLALLDQRSKDHAERLSALEALGDLPERVAQLEARLP